MFDKLKVPVALPELLELRPDLFQYMGVLLADIARNKNRPIVTVQGVSVKKFTPVELDEACTEATKARVSGVSNSISRPTPTSTEVSTTQGKTMEVSSSS